MQPFNRLSQTFILIPTIRSFLEKRAQAKTSSVNPRAMWECIDLIVWKALVWGLEEIVGHSNSQSINFVLCLVECDVLRCG